MVKVEKYVEVNGHRVLPKRYMQPKNYFMRVQILILIPLLSLLSCKSEQKSNTITSDSKVVDEKKVNIKEQTKNDTLERFFPSEKEIIKNDTLIQMRNIEIEITRNSLDSYIVNEFDSDGIKNIQKYRDFENHLLIKKDSKVLIDTILKKENFIENTGKEFQYISIFHGYWFNEIKDNRIELFGMISKPETDYSFAFQHFFDINTGEFEIKKSIDEEY